MTRSVPDRGFDFPTDLHDVICRSGPPDLSEGERQALVDHLIASATEWVRRRNRILKAVRQ